VYGHDPLVREKHCYDIPVGWSLRSIFEAVDGVDEIDDKFQVLTKDFDQLDALMPQMIAEFPPMIASMESMRTMMLTVHSTMSGIFGQMDDLSNNATAMGQGLRHREKRRLVLLAAGSFQQPRFQTSPEQLLLAGRESGTAHHFAPWRSRDAGCDRGRPARCSGLRAPPAGSFPPG